MRGIRWQGRKALLCGALVGALSFFLLGCGAHAEENRLERSLEATLDAGHSRAECEDAGASGHWRCAIEDDPGSGWSRALLVRVGEGDCWRAAPPSGRYAIDGCLDR